MKRKRDRASFQYAHCPTGDELLAYQTGGLPEAKRSDIFYHLNVEKCRRCRHLFSLLEAGSPARTRGERGFSPAAKEKILKRLRQSEPLRHRPPTPVKIGPGQIWATSPRPRNSRGDTVASLGVSFPVLVIYEGDGEKSLHNIIRVIPLSFDVEYHQQGETVLLDQDNPLCYPILVEIFNERPMLAGNLAAYRGSVSSEQLNDIMKARSQYLDESAPGDRELPGADLEGEPGGPTHRDDEFLAWKEKEIELAEYLSFPVNQALWEEDEELVQIAVHLEPYTRAADMGDHELGEVFSQEICRIEDAFFGIVQIRDMLLLRVVSDGPLEEIPRISMNRAPLSVEEKGPGIYEACLGSVEQIPEEVELTIYIKDRVRVFEVRFHK
ncbi:MAG: hypothetical protein JRJ12_16750 [Deltaproteobacteria bacterium]|nr:hypothetical protein [Deltaproteobacteria bacterium]MBW2072973.1 hypothetical protein [Deltaproteobacteria bacterium]